MKYFLPFLSMLLLAGCVVAPAPGYVRPYAAPYVAPVYPAPYVYPYHSYGYRRGYWR